LIQANALAASTSNTSVYAKFLPKLSAAELNPPLIVQYHNLAFISIPFIVVATVLCALYKKKSKDDMMLSPGPASPNVTTLPEAIGPIPKPSIVVDKRKQSEIETGEVELEAVG